MVANPNIQTHEVKSPWPKMSHLKASLGAIIRGTGLGSLLGVYLSAGPDFFYNFKDKKDAEISDVIINGKPATKDYMSPKKAQVAVNLGVGVKLLKKLQVGVTYQIPMGDSFEWKDVTDTTMNFSAKTKTWQVSAAYIF